MPPGQQVEVDDHEEIVERVAACQVLVQNGKFLGQPRPGRFPARAL